MLVYTADVAQTVRHAGRFGIGAQWAGADWPAIRDRVFGRIDPLHEQAVTHRRAGGIDVFPGEARFTGPKVLHVGGDEIRADRFVLAAGSRPAIPAVPGLADVPYLTSDAVMRLDALPRSMVVLGGGYIAAEMSHIFGSLGTDITIVARGEHLLSRHDADIRARFTTCYAARFDLRLGATAERVSATSSGVRLDLATPAGTQVAEGEVLLVATGRRPNSDRLDVAAGIEVDTHGHVRTDGTYATSVPGIWALGDLANHFQLKHMANAETRLVRYNLLHRRRPRLAQFTVVPSAVFADPQVASAGATEQELQAQVGDVRLDCGDRVLETVVPGVQAGRGQQPGQPGGALVAQEDDAKPGEDQPGDHRVRVQVERADPDACAAQPPPVADAEAVPRGGQREQRGGHPGGVDGQQRRAAQRLAGGGRDGEHRAQDRPRAEPGQAGHRAQREHRQHRLAAQAGPQTGRAGDGEAAAGDLHDPEPDEDHPGGGGQGGLVAVDQGAGRRGAHAERDQHAGQAGVEHRRAAQQPGGAGEGVSEERRQQQPAAGAQQGEHPAEEGAQVPDAIHRHRSSGRRSPGCAVRPGAGGTLTREGGVIGRGVPG
jgi:pyruvate/2-oxoglutarate dehydrogenase complex dihydrolipoamide dehydrogenase (E3) component